MSQSIACAASHVSTTEAVLPAEASTNVLGPAVDLRLVMACGACGEVGRPLVRAWGYPSPEMWRHEAEGRIILMGCVLPDPDGDETAEYECRHCGVDTFVVR